LLGFAGVEVFVADPNLLPAVSARTQFNFERIQAARAGRGLDHAAVQVEGTIVARALELLLVAVVGQTHRAAGVRADRVEAAQVVRRGLRPRQEYRTDRLLRAEG